MPLYTLYEINNQNVWFAFDMYILDFQPALQAATIIIILSKCYAAFIWRTYFRCRNNLSDAIVLYLFQHQFNCN